MRIAIVGTGISGLVSAWMLSRRHEVVVYEANKRLGGHTHTRTVTRADGAFQVDSGFIVFNRKNYPNFSKILEALGVVSQPTQMSFGLRSDADNIEYNGTDINSLFAQRSNIFKPSFWRMIKDILRFNKEALELLDSEIGYDLELGHWLDAQGYSREFVEHYVVPMGAALWSAPPEVTRQYPVRYFMEFFANHAMLQVDGRPQWMVVKGGSSTYVEKISASFADSVRLSTPVMSVERHQDGVDIHDAKGGSERFDAVVLACHSDQALRMLKNPSVAEQEILGAMPYRKNGVVLHTDTTILPRRRRAWAAWNYRLYQSKKEAPGITYDMNALQSLAAKDRFLVTLNRPELAEGQHAIESLSYEHPVYTPASVKAKARKAEISGVDRIWYCGAYWGHGFHEDGVNSALAVARDFGEEL